MLTHKIGGWLYVAIVAVVSAFFHFCLVCFQGKVAGDFSDIREVKMFVFSIREEINGRRRAIKQALYIVYMVG